MKDSALLDKKDLFESYLHLGPRPLSSYSFVSIFAWCDFFEFEFEVIDGCLCVFARNASGTFLYLPPLGEKYGTSTVEAVFDHMSGGKGPRPVNRIENISENSLSAFNGPQYNQYLKPLEYVYQKEDLVRLRGNKYKSKRHDCNCFESRHPGLCFEAYTEEDFDACRQLYRRWSKARASSHTDGVYISMLEENQRVHERLLTHARDLCLLVRVLKIDGRVVGYTFGYALDEETFCVYAEIADLNITGTAAFMFRNFCADEGLKRFSRINAMDDFAMPNVAQAKMSYHPCQLIASYTVSLKDNL